jgi:hypothetical protein
MEFPAAVFHFLFWATRRASGLLIHVLMPLFKMHDLHRSIRPASEPRIWISASQCDSTIIRKPSTGNERNMHPDNSQGKTCVHEGSVLDACQFGIHFKWNQWKWITIWKAVRTKNLSTTRNCDWSEGMTVMKCIWFEARQFGIRFKWNRWKWFALWKTWWTKNLNVTRNCDWFERRTTPKCSWSDVCQFGICFK